LNVTASDGFGTMLKIYGLHRLKWETFLNVIEKPLLDTLLIYLKKMN